MTTNVFLWLCLGFFLDGCLIDVFQICCKLCVWCGVSGLVVALVPAYNEEHYVSSVLVRLREYVDRVIVCDDGSVDLTGDIAEVVGATVVTPVGDG